MVAGMAVLFAGQQLYLLQLFARGESQSERLLVVALVPWFDKAIGRDAMLAPETLRVAWVIGGTLTAVGYVGLLAMVIQESARARKAAR
jgi:hypothetical protein